MHRKLIVGAVLALVVAVASVPLAFADEGPGGDDGHDGDVTVLKMTTRVLQEADVDVPPSGESVGDRFVFSDEVFKGDKKVGMTGGDCVLVLFKPGPTSDEEPEAVTALCVATVSLPKGQITVQGLLDFTESGPITLAVTGGTGAYRTAHGQMKLEEGEEEDQLTFKLILKDDKDDKDD